MTTRTAEKIPDHLIEQAKRADLVALAERHTTLRKESGREWAGPCPRCGGDDRFHVNAGAAGEGWWFCRQCHSKPGDSIAFLQWLTPGLSFRAAVEQLSGSGITSPAAAPAQRRQPEHRRPPVQPDGWRQRAERMVADAQRLLWAPEGEPARAYLASRALEPDTWRAFGLGLRPDAPLPNTKGKQRAPAVVLPWVAAGKLVAVRYRFLEPQTYTDDSGDLREGERLVAESGSQFAGRLFGGQHLPEWLRLSEQPGAERLRWLLILEGEINAMSAWQVAGASNLDVLSLGSESAKLSPAAVATAQRYGRALCWADRAEVAQSLMAALPGAYGVRSPGGRDANDLLRSGHLGGFLATVRADAATSMGELERLLWALWDAAGLPAGIDAGSAVVLKSLAAKLGKAAPVAEGEPGRWVQAQKEGEA
jgi:hypothetical protein